MNTITITGRLTNDPDVREAGTSTVCKLRVAVDAMTKGKDTGYVDVETWGKAAEACGKYLTKGARIGVEGQLNYEEWTNADEHKRSRHFIHGRVQFLDNRKDQASSTPQPGELDAIAF